MVADILLLSLVNIKGDRMTDDEISNRLDKLEEEFFTYCDIDEYETQEELHKKSIGCHELLNEYTKLYDR